MIAAGLVLAALATPALAPGAPRVIVPADAETAAPAGPKPAQIDKNGVLILIRTTLIALQQANETGNYTVLRDLGAPGFQQANTAARLGDIFANLRSQNLDLSGVTVLEPQLTLLPQIEGNGLMHMAGFFPSVPVQIKFELLYAAVGGRWKPFGVSVQLGSSAPAAPRQAVAATQAAAHPADKPKARARRKPRVSTDDVQ